MVELFPSREVAVSFLNFDIHWYGILYFVAFWIAYVSLPRLGKWRSLKFTHEDWASLLTWAVVGVIIGGRLGYVLLYEPVYFAQNPAEMFAVWKGGMSSHGGFIGVIGLLSYICWHRDLPVRRIADVAVVPAAVGLALGRFGNLINVELYGTLTTLPWGTEFPGVDGVRHPLQMYGVIQNIWIAAMCYVYLRRLPVQPGKNFALFLTLYGLCRFLLEFVREQTHTGFELGVITISRGQLYTLPILFLGLYLWKKWNVRTFDGEES